MFLKRLKKKKVRKIRFNKLLRMASKKKRIYFKRLNNPSIILIIYL
jgi:hypothetical protein